MNGVRNRDDQSIPMNDVPAYTPRKKLRVVTVGAGFSGLYLAHKIQHKYPELQESIIDHTIYEARSDVGGTWLVNTYPGVVCDVPSHIYVGHPSPFPTKSYEIPANALSGFPFRPESGLDSFLFFGP